MDFELLLVVLTLLTGAVWAWDRWLRATPEASSDGDLPPRRRDDDPWYIDLPRSLFPVILIVLLIRSFAAEPFRIPSGSMIPTLYAGDFILVSKTSYGVRLPVLGSRLFGGGKPDRGEVAVFRYPVDPSQDYIKRIIGLPGDEIRYEDRQLSVNGETVAQQQLGAFDGGGTGEAFLLEETLGEATYRILVHPGSPPGSFEYTVPDGEYFVLGDNRDRSADSRMWGPVTDDQLVGRAFLIWMSWDSENRRLNWDRIGERIE